MYKGLTQPVIEIRESAIKYLASNTENSDKIVSLLCDLIQMDTLLQPFPYNNEYRANREKLIEELKTYIESKVHSE